MAITNQTTLTTADQIKFVKDLIPILKGQDLLSKFADKEPVERMGGDTVKWNRVLRIPHQTTFNLGTTVAAAEAAYTATPKALTSNAIKTNLKGMGDVLQFTEVADLASIVTLPRYREAVADQILRSKGAVCSAEISTHCLRHRVDNDALYEVTSVPTGTLSTTGFADTVLSTTYADHAFGTDSSNFGFVCGINPSYNNYDVAVKCTHFAQSGDVFTLEETQQAWEATSTYHAVNGLTMAATDLLTLAGLTRVAAIHERFGTEKFNGGRLIGMITTSQKQDLYKDTVYQAIMQYSKPEIVGKFEVIPVLDHDLIVNNDGVYREDLDGSVNWTTGIIHVMLSFGKHAYGVTKWGDGDDWGLKVLIWGLNDPDTGNMYGMQGYISWKCLAAVQVIRATSIVGLMTGATALPVDF